ncbi:hypothetical protein [Allohahella marinimesophila]|uniref:Uncharacterized protein n=1 Tax=Allohahella marinimesophila TaxID=1054972 RepID=A0ABP7PW43_9GAMM
MSTKATIASDDRFHFYEEVSFSDQLTEVFLQLDDQVCSTFEKDISSQQLSATVAIPADVMDQIAIAWIKKRRLQGAVGGPVGNEWGSPDCPYE